MWLYKGLFRVLSIKKNIKISLLQDVNEWTKLPQVFRL